MHATLADVIADTAQNSIEAGARHIALSLVEDGTTIRVRIADGSHSITPTEESLSIKVLPPWFRSWWAILLFSLLVALANRLLTVRGLHIVLRILIHYATLLAAFLIVFVAAGKLKISGPAAVFLSVMIFTVLYAVCFTAGYFLLRLFGAIQKPEKNGGSTPYDSRFR